MATTLSRLGENFGGAADPQELFLKVFGGEVYEAFTEKNQFMDLTEVSTITEGKSASFPILGTAAAQWHTAGSDLLTGTDADGTDYGNSIGHTEREIFIDNVLTSHVLVPDIDRLKNHYEYRGKYIKQLGHALSKQADEHILASILAGALAAENISGITGRPAAITAATAKTDAGVLVASIFTAAAEMDAVDVPEEDRYVAVSPAQYYLLNQSTDLVDRDTVGFGADMGRGTVLRVAGFTIIKTNNMPTTDLSAVADTGSNNDVFGAAGVGYNGNWATVAALCFQREAAGTVKMLDLAMESEWRMERQAEFILAKYAMGHSFLRPECSVLIKTA